MVLIDRIQGREIDEHLAEKFSIGITGEDLPYDKESKLSNIIGFHYSAIGQSHFTSMIDIIIGTLRFSINSFTRHDAARNNTALNLLRLISPLFHRNTINNHVTELGLTFSPKSVRKADYRKIYFSTKEYLESAGIETEQEIEPATLQYQFKNALIPHTNH